ncbi:MAG: REP-associated tyrosine transposase [Coraliomargarita sp.]
MQSEQPKQGYRALRRGRVSISHARYFLTVVTKDRQRGLACSEIYDACLNLLHDLPAHSLALVLMEDHLHWLFQLSNETSLSEMVRLFKGRLSPELRRLGIRWQSRAYHDRRLRPDDELAPFLRYMLCNPYREGLCAVDERWPFWYCDSEVSEWFEPTTNEGRPWAEWIATSEMNPWEIDDQDDIL